MKSKIELTDGSPTDYKEINPLTGQQKGYIILSKEERAKGFIRPVRDTYWHVGHDAVFSKPGPTGYVVLIKVGTDACGTRTTMKRAIAETYARNPKFYNGTFCVSCREHLPLDQFVWEGTTEIVGS